MQDQELTIWDTASSMALRTYRDLLNVNEGVTRVMGRLRKRALLAMSPKRLDLAPIVKTFIPRLGGFGFIFWEGEVFTVPGPMHVFLGRCWDLPFTFLLPSLSAVTYLLSEATTHSSYLSSLRHLGVRILCIIHWAINYA